jgi:hypothetical protein
MTSRLRINSLMYLPRGGSPIVVQRITIYTRIYHFSFSNPTAHPHKVTRDPFLLCNKGKDKGTLPAQTRVV